MPDPGPGRGIADLMEAFRKSRSYSHDDAVAARLCEGMDLSRRHYAAREFIGLPQAAFAARAYAACFGQPPATTIFAQLRDRLLDSTVSQTACLRELAKEAQKRGVRISGLRRQAIHDGVARGFAADIVLSAARLTRDLSRLPGNLRRKLEKKPPPPPADIPSPRIAASGGPRIAILAVAGDEMGGAERFYAGLLHSLNQAGMAAELVQAESREHRLTEVAASYRRFHDLDLSAYAGVISSKAPTYAVRHPNHVCYLMHTMRSWCDMFEASHPFAPAATRDTRRRIQALDTAALQNVPTLFSIGEEVSQRLRVYNGLDAKVLHLPSTLPGLHEGPFEHLLLPGRLHPWKRVDLAIAAMRHVTAPVKLLIAGTGQEEARLRASARHNPRIVFTGRVTEAELASLYAGAAAVLFLPRREDLGLVTLEAFAAAKPVITCNDSGEPARFVHDGENGFVCDPEPKAIAARIEDLVRDKRRAAALGQAGRDSIASIRWENVARTLIAALRL